MLSQQGLQSKLDKSIKENDIEGVRKAFEQGAVPINICLFDDGFMRRTMGTAIYSECSEDLIKLLLEKGAKIVNQGDDPFYCDDLYYAINLHDRVSYIKDVEPQQSCLHVIKSLLKNGAVVANDLSTLAQEMINVIEKYQKEEFDEDLITFLESITHINPYSQEHCKKVFSRLSAHGVKPCAVKLARSLLKTKDPTCYCITTYKDINNRVIKLRVELKKGEENQSFCQEYHTTLYEIFNSNRCDIAKTANIAKLVMDYDKNSIVSGDICGESHERYLWSTPDLEKECRLTTVYDVREGYQFTTAYQIAQLIWKMLNKSNHSSDEDQQVVADLIGKAMQCGIGSDEIINNINIVHDEWKNIYADARRLENNKDFPSEDQLLARKDKAIKYVEECISGVRKVPEENDEVSYDLSVTQFQNLNIAGPSRQ
ncbi:MAG: hypothetical protein U0X86_000432 [Wolbachia endosymbiont of Xenopsylla cheopis]